MNCYDKIIKFHKENDIQYERYSLLSLAFLFLLLDKNYYNDYLFVSFISFFSSFVIFCNFPFIITWNNAKPIYYEELYIDSSQLPEFPLDDEKKEVYLKFYTRALILSCSIFVSILTSYWKFRTEDRSSIEIIGITGGLLQMATILNNLTGRCILYCIRTFITTKICDLSNISDIEENKTSNSSEIAEND
tara:strand:- start:11990 stop:12559 length:570 start_codon:yes stop_codon:yes gene_type:complete